MKKITVIISLYVICLLGGVSNGEKATKLDPFFPESGIFPINDNLSTTMLTALNYFNDYAKKNNLKFNPRSSYVVGGKAKGEGIWVFVDIDKHDMTTMYMYYFPQNKCIIAFPSPSKVKAFKRDGTPIKLPSANESKSDGDPDPFDQNTH